MARTKNPVGKGAKAVGRGTPGTIGSLATFTLPDEGKRGTTVVRSWNAHGLDVDDLPGLRMGYHIFQSACRSVETRRGNGAGVEIKVDEVLHDAGEVLYQVTRLVRDKTNRIIEHPKAMTIAFDKGTDQITVRELEDYDSLRGLEEQIRKHFAKHAKDIPGNKLRNAIRETLLKIGAQNLRRKAGGLYFVPDVYRTGSDEKPTMPVLDALAGVLGDLYGDRADFYIIPLADDKDMKAMVAKHFALNVAEESRALMEEALQRVRTGKGERGVRADFLARLWNERRRLSGAVDQFDSLVNLERGEIDKNIRDLDDALAKLGELAT